MKRTVHILRGILCALVAFYTVYLAGHTGYSVYMKCHTIKNKDDAGLYSAWDHISKEAWSDIAVGVLLLVLGTVCIILLFRAARVATVGSAVCAVAQALLGLSLDTLLSEFMFMRYQLGISGITVELAVVFKPVIACLCICAAILYAVFFLVDFYHSHRKENLS